MPPWIDIRAPLVNPLGNPLSQYSSATWINLGQPGVLVDFTALGTGTPLPAGTLPGGGSYVQAAGSGQTEETWVTSWTSGTLARMAFVANTPKIGVAPNGLVGLRLRRSWTNYVRRSDAIDAWTITGTAVVAANNVVSPDGATNADTLTDDDGAAYELANATVDPIPTDTERYRFEAFLKSTAGQTHAAAVNWGLTGGTPITDSLRLNTNDGTATLLGLSTTPAEAFGSWWRWSDSVTGNGTNTGAGIALYPAATTIPLPGADTVAGTGAKAVYGVSITRGKLRCDYQPTGATGATCADCAATYPASRLVRGGRLRLRFRWTPSGAPTDYNTNFRIVDHGAEVTYCEFSATDQKLRIQVAGGAVETCAVPMWWPSASLYSTSHPVVEVDLEIGGNVATRIRYRYSTDGGVTWTLPFDPLGGAAGVAQGNVSSSGSIGVLTGAAAGAVADGWLHEHEAILTAPAWALQALPTDVASVKAFFRADSSYTLSAGTVSAWAGQTATAVTPFTQGTGANQPALTAAAFGSARPGITTDGTNDYMTGADITSVWTSTNKTIYVLVRVNAVSLDNALPYANHSIVQDSGSYSGLVARAAAPRFGVWNFTVGYDATYSAGGLSVGTPAVVRLRHSASTVGVRVGSGAEATIASGATTWGAGPYLLRMGTQYNAGGGYTAADFGAMVFGNAEPSAGEDAAIMSFLNAYGGLP